MTVLLNHVPVDLYKMPLVVIGHGLFAHVADAPRLWLVGEWTVTGRAAVGHSGSLGILGVSKPSV